MQGITSLDDTQWHRVLASDVIVNAVSVCLLNRCIYHLQERLLALSRRARRALERELHASHQQRSSGSTPLNRSSSAQPAGQGTSGRPQEGQGTSRDAERPQDGPRAVDRRAGGRAGPQARQKELSDRALRILEELSSLGRQVLKTFSRKR